MTRSAANLPSDPILVLIDDDEPEMTVDEWLDALDEDEPTEIEVNAAEILREIREHGEH